MRRNNSLPDCTCTFCGSPGYKRMWNYCQSCYRYFITEKKKLYPIPKKGEIVVNDNGDPICWECGMAFRKLGNHLAFKHGIVCKDYYKELGLTKRSKVSNKDYQAHMKEIQWAETISINLLEKGKKTRFKKGWNKENDRS